MNPYITYAIYAVLSAAVLVGLYMQSRVKSAVAGNLLCVGAMLAAIVVTFITNSANIWFVLVAVAVGTVVGLVWAKKVKMIEMPQMVGMLNGIGGLASAMVGAIELMTGMSLVVQQEPLHTLVASPFSELTDLAAHKG